MHSFPFYKNKKGGIKTPSWELIAPRALEMGKMKLYRRVACQDLHAQKCNSHAKCRNMFNLEYSNFWSKQEKRRGENP